MKVKTAAEQLLFLTLRIETSNSIGTGFIVTHEWKDQKTSDKLTGFFLITNKHIIRNTTGANLIFTRVTKELNADRELDLGQVAPVRIGANLWRWWFYHPSTEIDVAALPLTPVFESLPDKGKTLFFRHISTEMMPSTKSLEDLDALENITFVGYPNNVYDRSNNLPIFRRGITATPPNVDYEGKPIFLIDASVFPGSSGSPVFLYNVGSWVERSGPVLGGQRVIFLGVLASVLCREADGSLEFKEIPTNIMPVIKTTEMIDLGVVFKARTVLETIEHGLRNHGLIP